MNAFDKWFDNSKVVDAAGMPMVVYHGTNADFKKFNKSKNSSASGNTGFFGGGFYATASPEVASDYADQDGGNVMPLYMQIENPLLIGETLSQEAADALNEAMEIDDIFDEGNTWRMVQDGLTMTFNSDPDMAKIFSSNLEGNGFDGIIVKDFREVVVFNANQIKSSIGNNGKFDRKSDDIRK